MDENPGSAAEPVARVEGLHVTFTRAGRRIHALRGVDLSIAPGEIVGLVGESGSGKSVLGLSLLGLLAGNPDLEGRALVSGIDMLTAPETERRRVRRLHLGAVFQDPMTSLNPTMTVGRQVAEAAGSGAEAIRLLTAVGIPDAARRASSYPHELSGGLRQRVMIAIAVAGDPALVIADEPTTALDVTVQAQVLRLIRRLRDEIGCAFVLVTHDLGVAAQVADRVAVLYGGRLAELGATPTVLHEAAHPYSVALMRSRLSLATDRDRPLVALGGDVPDPGAPPPGCPFAPRCELAHDACLVSPPAPRAVAVTDGGPHLSACVLDPAEVRDRMELPPTMTGADGAAGPTGPTAVDQPTEAPAVDGPAEPTEPPAVDRPTEPIEIGGVTEPTEIDGAAEPGGAVRVSGLTRTFHVRQGWHRRTLQALRGVTLTVRPGEAVAVVGESGSGKSTLLRAIAGLDRSPADEVTPIAAQMVFQDAGASLTPWLTIGQLIAERLRGQGLSRKQRDDRVAEVLRRVGLPPAVATAKARQLSGGQRQRVGVARAIVVPPQVLLCDEPTSALDVSLAASVINLLGDLRRQLGMSLVFVTHDLAVARIVADRIAVMYLGRIVELGTAEEITTAPRHPYTQALVAAIPDFGVEAPPTRGEPASPLAPPAGCSYHPRCAYAVRSCADPQLDPRLERIPGEGLRLVACIRSGATASPPDGDAEAPLTDDLTPARSPA